LIETGGSFRGGHYEVRSGGNAGTAGALVASASLLTAAGFSLVLNGDNGLVSDYLGRVLRFARQTASQGRYHYVFLSAPIDGDSERSFGSATSGLNRLGNHTANTA
jgi:hypothetical protein